MIKCFSQDYCVTLTSITAIFCYSFFWLLPFFCHVAFKIFWLHPKCLCTRITTETPLFVFVTLLLPHKTLIRYSNFIGNQSKIKRFNVDLYVTPAHSFLYKRMNKIYKYNNMYLNFTIFLFYLSIIMIIQNYL